LEDGPPIFRQDFSCPALLVASSVPHRSFHVRGYHPLWPAFPSCSVKSCAITCRLFRFRSPLLSESRLMSFPRATEMFQFTRFASHDYVFIMRYRLRGGFPHSEISGSKLICQLPEAYRRLSRPSSPVIAKASTICSYSLDPITLTSLARDPSRFKELPGLSPGALCRTSKNRFDSKLKFILDAIKNSVADGTVCTKPLRMCSFHQQR
jgi:hypothetical protein